MHFVTIKAGFPYCEETIGKLMRELGLTKHTSTYHSYKGTVGRIALNFLNQDFSAIKPFTVLHTDVSQVKLTDGSGDISQVLKMKPVVRYFYLMSRVNSYLIVFIVIYYYYFKYINLIWSVNWTQFSMLFLNLRTPNKHSHVSLKKWL
jgi:hypothetical protein